MAVFYIVLPIHAILLLGAALLCMESAEAELPLSEFSSWMRSTLSADLRWSRAPLYKKCDPRCNISLG